MANSDFLKYCKYYKGEEYYPSGKDADFWLLEKYYVTTNVDHKHWETEGLKMCYESYPETKPFISNFKEPFVRGMLAYMVLMTAYNVPITDANFILNYGK
jgi:hypothetical protein